MTDNSYSLVFFQIKPPGYKVICVPKTILQKKKSKTLMKTFTIHMEDDDQKAVGLMEKQ